MLYPNTELHFSSRQNKMKSYGYIYTLRIFAVDMFMYFEGGGGSLLCDCVAYHHDIIFKTFIAMCMKSWTSRSVRLSSLWSVNIHLFCDGRYVFRCSYHILTCDTYPLLSHFNLWYLPFILSQWCYFVCLGMILMDLRIEQLSIYNVYCNYMECMNIHLYIIQCMYV